MKRVVAMLFLLAEDVAGVANFLAGPDADYITGQSYHVDGGVVMI